MLRNLKSLNGAVIQATEGELGHVIDFLFDDHQWVIRYIVVETGSWFSRRQVLISPEVTGKPLWETPVIPVNLTMDQVRDSPDVDTANPVSRQEEIAMSQYYGWPDYWSMETPVMAVAGDPSPTAVAGDPHLRSAAEVSTYAARAADGDLGGVDDLIMEDSSWQIRYFVVSAGGWLSGKQLLVATSMVNSIRWSQRQLVLSACRADL